MKNAYYGYTYQHLVTLFVISRMDVERKIDLVEIEAVVNNNFDDLTIQVAENKFFLQMKDMKDLSISDIIVSQKSVLIKGREHLLSEFTNVLICKEIKIEPNTKVLDLPAYYIDGLNIISLSRTQIFEQIGLLYKSNSKRRYLIDSFVNNCLDERKLSIRRTELPSINAFKTNLLENTVDVGIEQLKLENIFVIEGKPGVGKSHLVNLLKNQIRNNIVYRFWTSNQDKDYRERLKYDNFLVDLSKKLFRDLISRNESEIISEIEKRDKTVIIDGLDHIENNNLSELECFIKFLNELKVSCKLIVLTRPLKRNLNWSKYVLRNWNAKQTDKVLDELYHISDFTVKRQIYELSDGYPILVKYIAEYYKKNLQIPPLKDLSSIENYYDQILKEEKGKQALSLFLCFRAFVMKSEIESFIGEELAVIVEEFITEHPYLFELRLNRVSLFHDSLITYLRNLKINYTTTFRRTHQFVLESIMMEDPRFLSRYGLFNFELDERRKVLKKYSCIETFKRIELHCIDFESLQAFYSQLILELEEMSPDVLDIYQYYDLSLISNIIYRDHVSSLNGFYCTYVRTLLFNGYSELDVTSSRYLFAMFYFLQTGDSTLLFNLTSDDLYSIKHFHMDLELDIKEETEFFTRHEKPLSIKKINDILAHDDTFLSDRITFILTNIYLHETRGPELEELHHALHEYLKGNFRKGLNIMISYLDDKHSAEEFYASMILSRTRETILSFGKIAESNEYKLSTLKDLILGNQELGSFDLQSSILSYIRLSLYENRKIDISSISFFWTKYYQRKDYTLFSVPSALRTFEDKGIIEFTDSVELIDKIQVISEKGYRGLLNDYLEMHPPEFIKKLDKKFDLTELRGLWFLLSRDHINVIPMRVFNSELISLMNYHRHDKTIDYDEIKNVIESKRKNDLKERLSFLRYSIRVPKVNPIFQILRDDGFLIVESLKNDNYTSDYAKSQNRYERGTLNKGDLEFIQQKIKSPQELAGFDNGYYSTLADLDLFMFFDKNEIRGNISEIMYNAFLGKVESNITLPRLYYMPGNIPKVLSDYEISVDFRKLYKSFYEFISLSSFNIPVP